MSKYTIRFTLPGRRGVPDLVIPNNTHDGTYESIRNAGMQEIWNKYNVADPKDVLIIKENWNVTTRIDGISRKPAFGELFFAKLREDVRNFPPKRFFPKKGQKSDIFDAIRYRLSSENGRKAGKRGTISEESVVRPIGKDAELLTVKHAPLLITPKSAYLVDLYPFYYVCGGCNTHTGITKESAESGSIYNMQHRCFHELGHSNVVTYVTRPSLGDVDPSIRDSSHVIDDKPQYQIPYLVDVHTIMEGDTAWYHFECPKCHLDSTLGDTLIVGIQKYVCDKDDCGQIVRLRPLGDSSHNIDDCLYADVFTSQDGTVQQFICPTCNEKNNTDFYGFIPVSAIGDIHSCSICNQDVVLRIHKGHSLVEDNPDEHDCWEENAEAARTELADEDFEAMTAHVPDSPMDKKAYGEKVPNPREDFPFVQKSKNDKPTPYTSRIRKSHEMEVDPYEYWCHGCSCWIGISQKQFDSNELLGLQKCKKPEVDVLTNVFPLVGKPVTERTGGVRITLDGLLNLICITLLDCFPRLMAYTSKTMNWGTSSTITI